MISVIAIILGFASYAFVILSVFRLLRVNYFNPIVKIFATYLEPVSKSIFFFLPPLIAAIAFALVLKFSSFYLAYSSGYETLTLFYVSAIDVLNSGFRILFYCVIGSVVLSWVAPGNNHPLLQIIEEISAGILSPVRRFLPPMGGLDFTPIIGLLVLNLINSSLVQIISSLV
jgi:YggT family protein